MKTRFGFLFLLAALFLVQATLWAQSDTTLLATTDLDCTWKLDGKPQGNLKADDSIVIPVSLGKHLVQAVSADGQVKFRSVVNIKQAGQEMVEIKLKEPQQRQSAKTEPAAEPTAQPTAQPAATQPAQPAAQSKIERVVMKPTEDPTWTDPATGLMWAGKDNGSNLTWAEANSYCSSLKIAGYTNWKLPSINEFSGIYDETLDVNNAHIKGGIRVTGLEWTSNAPNSSGEHQLFNFVASKKGAFFVVYSKRALCVRQP